MVTIPNRILKESVTTSENLSTLTAEAERLFYRLMTQSDDFGLMYANPKIVRSKCFPLTADKITEETMRAWLAELEKAELVEFYESGGKQYLRYINWDKHQSRRAQHPKYPLPETGESICMQMQAEEPHTPEPIPAEPDKPKVPKPKIEKPKAEKKPPEKNEVAPAVFITAEEMEKLATTHGTDGRNWMIKRLSDYKISNGKTYKNDYAAIGAWVVDAWQDHRQKHPAKTGTLERYGAM